MKLRDSHTNHGPRFPKSWAVLISLLAISTPTTRAETHAQEPEEVIRVRTDLVAVPVIVTDGKSRRIAGLKQEDFLLSNDGRNAKIEYFASAAQRVALAFLLDNSGSLREQLTRQRDAALALCSRFGAGSSVAIINFGARANVATLFTGDLERARLAFLTPATISERTAIFDAALVAVNAFRSRADNVAERRIAILISDGLDTASTSTSQSVIQSAIRADVSFYVIQLPLFTPREGRLVARPAAKGFRELAEKTGGKYFVAGSVQTALDPDVPIDLTPVFAAIEDDLRSQYVLGFYPGEGSRDTRVHTVAVSLSNPKYKRVRVRQVRTTYELKR